MQVNVICNQNTNQTVSKKLLKKEKYLVKKGLKIKSDLDLSQLHKMKMDANAAKGIPVSKKERAQFDKEAKENEANVKMQYFEQPEATDKTIFTKTLFSSLDLPSELIKRLSKAGYKHMTQIQQASIPVLMQKKNCAIKSETGSGKTLAYLLPILAHLQEENSPQLLVLCPTRELSLQISQLLTKLTEMKHLLLTGGNELLKEKSQIRLGADVVIATPGRLLYHLKSTQRLKFDNLKFIVFEESDRILDMGFQQEVESIIKIMNEKEAIDRAVKVLISATFNERIENLCLSACKSKMTFIGFYSQQETIQDNKIDIPANLKQTYVVLQEDQKLSFLIAYLNSIQKKTIVFTHTIDQVEFLTFVLQTIVHRKNDQNTKDTILKQKIFKLHGNVPQNERVETYNTFKNTKESAILICTDVASRGLDFYDVTNTILLDMPESLTEYTHRIGRTARMDTPGTSLLMLFFKELKFKDNIRQYSPTEVKPDSIYDCFKKNHIRLYIEAKKAEQYIQSIVRQLISTDNDLFYKARKAYNSYCRAYAFNKDKTFHLKALNLFALVKSFGLKDVKSKSKETSKEAYKQDLLKRQTDKNEYMLQRGMKKNKISNDNRIYNMEFM